jgi:nucleoredoxin
MAEAETTLENIFGTADLKTKDGVVSPASLAGKYVGVYFSAHWCPPCRRFTPKLASTYNFLQATGKPFEVIFVSADR